MTDEVRAEPSKLAYVVVCLIFVASGSMSTIASKWSDMATAKGKDGVEREFNHPFFQTWLMFLGEFTCMIYFQFTVWRKRRSGAELVEGVDFSKRMNPLLFGLCASFDFTASTTMYFALNMTQASTYQMLRGSTILFTGIFSRIFLKRKFRAYQWTGMGFSVIGLALVGLSSTLFSSGGSQGSNPVLGDILVVVAQIVVATQMIVEEKILTMYNIPPTLLVGWEGTFGLLYTTTALGIFQAFHGKPDDVVDAVYQIGNGWQVAVSCALALLSFPLLNSCGQWVTSRVSATARMVLDTVRNAVVWIFTLAYTSYFKEKFQWLQLVGFIVLLFGNATFKGFIKLPFKFCGYDDANAAEEADTAEADGAAGADVEGGENKALINHGDSASVDVFEAGKRV